MKTGMFIHTTVNGRDTVFPTANLDDILSDKAMAYLMGLKQSDINYLSDDLAVAVTIITPDFEASGRGFNRNETVISKFESSEFVNLLKPEEKTALLRRADIKLNLSSRMQQYALRNGNVLSNPLPEVKL